MRTIYLIRHGKVDTDAGGRKCIGWTDVPLSPDAVGPAVRLGHWIRERTGRPLLAASGTLLRTRDTLRAILSGLGDGNVSELVEEEGFNEVQTGLWEGREFAEIRSSEPDLYEERGQSLGYFRFPEGESIYDAGERFEASLTRLMQAGNQDILVVSHSGTIRAFLCKLLGIGLDDFMKLGSANLSVCVLKEDQGILSVEKTAYKPTDLLDNHEIEWLYKRYKVPEPVIAHMRKTADFAEMLLNNLPAGNDLDGTLLKKAALVHDIARTCSGHAQRGADILRREGYYEIADLVEYHHSARPGPAEELTEEEILFYADKRVQEDRIVTLKERFDRSLSKCKTKMAREKHEALYQKSLVIEDKIKGKRCKRDGII